MPPTKASFEIRHRASDGATSVVSRSNSADVATLAFHTAVARLRSAQRDGDVLLVKQDPGDRVVLRQRLDASVHLEGWGDPASDRQ